LLRLVNLSELIENIFMRLRKKLTLISDVGELSNRRDAANREMICRVEKTCAKIQPRLVRVNKSDRAASGFTNSSDGVIGI
jgi:hypothetical protein